MVLGTGTFFYESTVVSWYTVHVNSTNNLGGKTTAHYKLKGHCQLSRERENDSKG